MQRDVDSAYIQFVHNFEDLMRDALNLRRFCNRYKPPWSKKTRHGEKRPQVDHAPLRLRQQIRQCRHIAIVIEQMKCFLRTCSESGKEAALETWLSVISSPGFQDGFAVFAEVQCGLILPTASTSDDLPVVQLLADVMSSTQSKCEYQLQKACSHSHKLFYE